MKRCIFGGAFDPIHKGHIQIVNYLIELNFDEIIILPTYNSGYKEIGTDYEKRIEMCELIFKDPRIVVSRIEQSINSSYTIDVLNYINDPTVILVLGSDQAKNFENWKDYKKILNNCKIMVYKRRGIKFKNKFNFEVYSFPIDEVSSTDIRNKMKNSESINELVDKKIYNFIKKNHLYRENYE